MKKEDVKRTALEVVKERYPFLVDNKYSIEAFEGNGFVVFGGDHRDLYGHLEESNGKVFARAYSVHAQSSKVCDTLKEACDFCIKFRFNINK